MPNQKKTTKLSILLCLSLLLTSMTGCGSSGSDAAGAAPTGAGGGKTATVSVAVETQEVENASIEEYSKISCKVKANDEVAIQPKVSGTVESVNVKVGDTVKAGDVLFTVDKTTLERQVTQANATYVQAQVNYDSIQNGSLDNQLATLKADVENKQTAYNNALQTYENNKALYESGAVSKSDLDALEVTMKSRQTELENAQRSLDLYQNDTMSGNVKTAQANLAQAKSNYDAAVSSLNDASVKAEISGTIGAVNVSVGSTVSTQTSAVTIVNLQPVKLVFGVTDRVINQLSVGTQANVTISSVSDEPFKASVTTISPTADASSGLYSVEIQLDNPNQAIKPGMFAMVSLSVDKHDNTISLPLDAVIEEDGESYVFVVNKDLTVSKKTVTTDLRNDSYIEVTSGLDVGDIVVVVGQDFLEEGNTANITSGPIPEGAEAAAAELQKNMTTTDNNAAGQDGSQGGPGGGGEPPQGGGPGM